MQTHYLIYNKAESTCELRIGDINAPISRFFQKVNTPRKERKGSNVYQITSFEGSSCAEDGYDVVFEAKNLPIVIIIE